MNKLTSYQTHKLIKRHVPAATTYWERFEKKERQMTLDQCLSNRIEEEEQWLDDHCDLRTACPEVFEAFMFNIKRNS